MTEFQKSLYAEYLEEMSFLYEHRCGALCDAEYSLFDIGDIDKRIEAHLDGLVLGGDGALRIVQACLSEPEAGELYTAARLFCRMDRPDLVLDCLGQLDWNDPEAVAGMLSGLKCELPTSWTQTILAWLRDFHPRLTALVAEAAGHRRLQVAAGIQSAVANAGPELSPRFLRALGQLREPSTMMVLYAHMQKPDLLSARTAAISVLRFGDTNVASNIMSYALAWSAIPLALVGDARAFSHLQRQPTQPDAVTAMGLLGDVRAVEVLIGCLAQEELASSAVSALYLLTGAPLHEDIEIESLIEDEDEDELDEDELDEDEEDFQDLPEEEPATFRRISTDPVVWTEWWARNQSRFSGQRMRYRLGELYTPLVSVTALRSTLLSSFVRELIADELLARHGVDTCYAPEQPVHEQLSAIASLQSQLAQSPARPGQW